MKFSIPPQTLAAIRHIAILAVLGALSVSILPAYDALSHSTSSMPVPVQELLDFILPVAYAGFVKFKAEIDAKLQAEENAKLLAQNASLAKIVEVQAKTMNNAIYSTPSTVTINQPNSGFYNL